MTEDNAASQALLRLLTLANRSVDICNPEPLSPILNRAEVISELMRVSRRGPFSMVRVLISRIESDLSRRNVWVKQLLRIPTKAQLRECPNHPDWRPETVVMIDGAQGLLLRSDSGAIFTPLGEPSVRRRQNHFEALWHQAQISPELASIS